MFKTVDKRKQQILTHIAESRLRTVDAVENTKQRVNHCVATAPLAISVLKLSGVATVGLITAGILTSKVRKNAKKISAAPETVSVRTVAMQLISLLVIPAIHACLTEKKSPAFVNTATAPNQDFARGFSSLFYRWLGLVK